MSRSNREAWDPSKAPIRPTVRAQPPQNRDLRYPALTNRYAASSYLPHFSRVGDGENNSPYYSQQPTFLPPEMPTVPSQAPPPVLGPNPTIPQTGRSPQDNDHGGVTLATHHHEETVFEYDDPLNSENPQLDVGIGSSSPHIPKSVTFPELAEHRGVAQWNNSVFDDRWFLKPEEIWSMGRRRTSEVTISPRTIAPHQEASQTEELNPVAGNYIDSTASAATSVVDSARQRRARERAYLQRTDNESYDTLGAYARLVGIDRQDNLQVGGNENTETQHTGVWKPTHQRPLTIIPPASRKFNPAGAVGDGRKVSRTTAGDGKASSQTVEPTSLIGSSRQSNLERIQAHNAEDTRLEHEETYSIGDFTLTREDLLQHIETADQLSRERKLHVASDQDSENRAELGRESPDVVEGKGKRKMSDGMEMDRKIDEGFDNLARTKPRSLQNPLQSKTEQHSADRRGHQLPSSERTLPPTSSPRRAVPRVPSHQQLPHNVNVQGHVNTPHWNQQVQQIPPLIQIQPNTPHWPQESPQFEQLFQIVTGPDGQLHLQPYAVTPTGLWPMPMQQALPPNMNPFLSQHHMLPPAEYAMRGGGMDHFLPFCNPFQHPGNQQFGTQTMLQSSATQQFAQPNSQFQYPHRPAVVRMPMSVGRGQQQGIGPPAPFLQMPRNTTQPYPSMASPFVPNPEWQNRFGTRQPSVTPSLPLLPYRSGSDVMYPYSIGGTSVRLQELTRNGRPTYEAAIRDENLPFAENTKEAQPAEWGVAKIANIPYSITKSEIASFLGRNAKTITPDLGTPIHIIMERSTGKTMDCYVEFFSQGDAQACVNKLLRGREEGGRYLRLGERHVEIEVSSQEQLMKELFPRAKNVEWKGGMPVVVETDEPFNSGFKSFVAMEELVMLVKHAEQPHRSPFTQKCPQRTYENLISTLHKFPWHAPTLYTLQTRNQLHSATHAQLSHLLSTLRRQSTIPLLLPTPHHHHSAPQLSESLLQDLLLAGLNTPGFSERQKWELWCVVSGGGIESGGGGLGDGGMGFGVRISPLGRWWPFEGLGRRGSVEEDVVEYYAHLLSLATSNQQQQEQQQQQQQLLPSPTISTTTPTLPTPTPTDQNPFGTFKIHYASDDGIGLTMEQVAGFEWGVLGELLGRVLGGED